MHVHAALQTLPGDVVCWLLPGPPCRSPLWCQVVAQFLPEPPCDKGKGPSRALGPTQTCRGRRCEAQRRGGCAPITRRRGHRDTRCFPPPCHLFWLRGSPTLNRFLLETWGPRRRGRCVGQSPRPSSDRLRHLLPRGPLLAGPPHPALTRTWLSVRIPAGVLVSIDVAAAQAASEVTRRRVSLVSAPQPHKPQPHLMPGEARATTSSAGPRNRCRGFVCGCVRILLSARDPSRSPRAPAPCPASLASGRVTRVPPDSPPKPTSFLRYGSAGGTADGSSLLFPQSPSPRDRQQHAGARVTRGPARTEARAAPEPLRTLTKAAPGARPAGARPARCPPAAQSPP